MWMEHFASRFLPDRRAVLPSIAITPAGTPVTAATQATKQAWNCSALERGQDVAQVIVGWRAILERPKAAEQPKLFDPEQGDLGEALGAREHERADTTIESHRVGQLIWLGWRGSCRSLK